MQKLKVAVDDFSPLVICKDGTYSGYDIDIWESIAKDLGLEFEYEEHKFHEIIPLLSEKKVDVGLGGISITRKREQLVDFTYPELDSGLQILVNKLDNTIGVLKTFGTFLRSGYKALLVPIISVFVFIFIFGNLLFFAESNAKTFSKSYIPGVFESSWLVIQSMSTDSFGDYIPHTWMGRIVTMATIFGGVALFGILIAEITAFITVQEIKGKINNYHDLVGKRVGVMRNTTAVRFCSHIGAVPITVLHISEAYEKLRKREIDAVIFDAPILRYFIENLPEVSKEFALVGDIFEKQKYGIAFPTGSLLREPVNIALLRLIESNQYDVLTTKWFGENTLEE